MDHELERFLGGLHTARALVDGTYVERQGLGKYVVFTEIAEIEEYFERLAREKPLTAYDTETGSLRYWDTKFPHLLSLHFSDAVGFGYTVPFDHPDSPWRIGGPKQEERKALVRVLRRFFEDESIPKIGQNEKFDRQHIKHRLLCEVRGVVRDTMTTHLMLDDRRGTHGLLS